MVKAVNKITQEEMNLWMANAVIENNLENVKTGLELGADPNAITGDETLLVKACHYGMSDIAKVLIKAGADINAKEKLCDAPLITAARSRSVETVKLLLDCGAEVDISNAYCLTALHYAVHSEIILLLLNAGANVDIKDHWGRTPLMNDMGRKNTDNVITLIRAGAELNIQDVQGNTPLIHAAYNGKTDVMDVLIEAGADTEIKNNRRRTALDILKDKYPEKYNLWRLRQVLKQEDSPSTTGSYNEPDFDI